MSIATNERPELEFDTADRLRKALRVADLGVADMADYLGVNRNTVSAWINGRIRPKRQTLILWAMRTGVPLVWLTNEDAPPADEADEASDGDVRPKGLEPPTFCSGASKPDSPVIPLFREVEEQEVA